MKNRKGFTLIELMVVVLIVAILAAAVIPILRGRIDAAKWSEGKAGCGTIATAMRAYHAENGPTGTAPTGLFGNIETTLGFAVGDLEGAYFTDNCYTLTVNSMDPLNFDILCTAANGTADAPANPATYTLDEVGSWQ